MTPEEIAANADALQQAFGKLGITPEMAFMEEGRSLAGDRYNNALQRAMELGMNGRVAAIQSKIERDATTHTRREMLRLARAGTAGEQPPQSSVPLSMSLGTSRNPAIRGKLPASPNALLAQGIDPASMMPMQGEEFAPREATQAPFPYRAVGRVGSQIAGGIAGGVGGGAVGGIPGVIVGGGLGSAGAGQGYDAAADWLMGTQQRAPILSGQTAADAIMGAVPGLRALGAYSTVPRGVGTGLATGLAVETAEGRGPLAALTASAADRGRAPPNQAIMRLQEQLRDAGYYNGPIDGVLSPDSPTMRAKERYEADQKASADAANRAAAAAAQTKEAEARAAEAAAKSSETARLTAESNRRAQERAAGERRLREIDDSYLSRGLNAAMTIGPWVGYAAGGWLGHRMQNALSGRVDNAATARAAAADAVMAQPVANPDIPGRIGRLNRLWGEGNPAREEAFTYVPGRRPYPYQPNPDAPAVSDLYQPTWGTRAAEWLPVPTVGGVEHIATEVGLARPARDELAAAQNAVQADPSEANIQRLQIARARMAAGDLTSRLGLGIGVGAAGRSVLHGLGDEAILPQSLARAERERGMITNLLMPQRGRRGGGGGSSGGGQKGTEPVADPRLGGSGHRDPVTGRIVPRPD